MNRLTDPIYWDSFWSNSKTLIDVDVQSDLHSKTLHKLFKRYLKRENKVLEVGCGSSKWLIYFSKNFDSSVCGIDYSKRACRISKNSLGERKISGEIICGDICNSSLKKGAFDVVFSSGLIEHFSNPILILKEMSELVAPNGHLVTNIPNLESLYWFIQKKIDQSVYRGHTKISIERLADFYEQVGFELDVIQYVGGFDLFSIEWSRLRSRGKFWRQVGMPLIGKTNAGINRFLQTFSIDFQSRLFSPFILALGHKKFG